MWNGWGRWGQYRPDCLMIRSFATFPRECWERCQITWHYGTVRQRKCQGKAEETKMGLESNESEGIPCLKYDRLSKINYLLLSFPLHFQLSRINDIVCVYLFLQVNTQHILTTSLNFLHPSKLSIRGTFHLIWF